MTWRRRRASARRIGDGHGCLRLRRSVDLRYAGQPTSRSATRHGPDRVHPRHPGLSQAGHPVQGHHAAAGRPGGVRRRRSTGWPITTAAGRSTPSPPPRPAASCSPPRWPCSCTSRSSRCASRASCRTARYSLKYDLEYGSAELHDARRRRRAGRPRAAGRRRAGDRRHDGGRLPLHRTGRRLGRRLCVSGRTGVPRRPQAAGRVRRVQPDHLLRDLVPCPAATTTTTTAATTVAMTAAQRPPAHRGYDDRRYDDYEGSHGSRRRPAPSESGAGPARVSMPGCSWSSSVCLCLALS